MARWRRLGGFMIRPIDRRQIFSGWRVIDPPSLAEEVYFEPAPWGWLDGSFGEVVAAFLRGTRQVRVWIDEWTVTVRLPRDAEEPSLEIRKS